MKYFLTILGILTATFLFHKFTNNGVVTKVSYGRPVEKMVGSGELSITMGATSTLISTGFSTGTGYSWSHTTESGSNLLVLTAAIWEDAAPNGNISALTYGGQAMTKAIASTTSGTTMDVEIWYLVNPPSGSNTVSITLSGSTDARKFMAIALKNTNTASPLDVTTSGGGSSLSSSINITTNYDKEWLVDSFESYNGTSPTIVQSILYKDTTGSTNVHSSYIQQTSAGLANFTTIWTTAGDYTHVIASFRAGLPPPQNTVIKFNNNIIFNKNIIIN